MVILNAIQDILGQFVRIHANMDTLVKIVIANANAIILGHALTSMEVVNVCRDVRHNDNNFKNILFNSFSNFQGLESNVRYPAPGTSGVRHVQMTASVLLMLNVILRVALVMEMVI